MIADSIQFPNKFRTRTSVPARRNEVKGAAIVCRAHHVFRHSLNTYFHCNALKAAVIWQTETGKATCFAGVVCEELHHLLHMRCERGTGEWADVQRKVLK